MSAEREALESVRAVLLADAGNSLRASVVEVVDIIDALLASTEAQPPTESVTVWGPPEQVWGQTVRRGFGTGANGFQAQPPTEPTQAEVEAAGRALGHMRAGVTNAAIRRALKAAAAHRTQEGHE